MPEIDTSRIFPPPPFSDPIQPVTAENETEWANRVLGTTGWTLGTGGGKFVLAEQCVAVNFDTCRVRGPAQPVDRLSFLAITGRLDPAKPPSVYPATVYNQTRYQGWTGGGWSDAPPVPHNGVFWYRLIVRWHEPYDDPNSLLYFNGTMKVWAYRGLRRPPGPSPTT